MPILPPKYFCIHPITCTFVVTPLMSHLNEHNSPLNALLSLSLLLPEKYLATSKNLVGSPLVTQKFPILFILAYRINSKFLAYHSKPNHSLLLPHPLLSLPKSPSIPIEAFSILRNTCSMELLDALPLCQVKPITWVIHLSL